MNRRKILWLYVFLIASVIDLGLIANNLWDYRIFTKPLVILSLKVYFIKVSVIIKGSLLRKSVCSALVFSLIGDLLLLDPQLYMYGLGAFLMVHICYILAFKLAQKSSFQFPRLYFIKLFVYNSPVYLLSAFFYFLIHNKVYHLKIPVIIYLCAMVLLCTIARERFQKTNASSFWQVLAGAYLFFLSQGIFMINFFYQPLPEAAILIMGTYLLAQLLIVFGIRSHFIYVIHQKMKDRL